jgi:hypothetical protein
MKPKNVLDMRRQLRYQKEKCLSMEFLKETI